MQNSGSSGNLDLPPGSAELISVPFAELRQVEGEKQALVAEGPFAISTIDVAGETQIRAQVNGTSWVIQPASQTLKVGELSFVFSTPAPGTYYALTLGAATEPEALGILEAVLENLSLLKESERLLGDTAAQEGAAALAQGVTYRYGLAKGVHRASSGIASGLMVTATYASGAFERATGYLKSGQPTTQPVQLSEGFTRRVAQTASAAQWLSKAAGSVVGGLAWLGGKVAGGVLWAVGADKPLQPGEEAGLMSEVSHAALGGFTEVWDSMEEAGLLVLRSARDNTASVVEHRYGAEAGAVSAQGLNAAGYTADAAWAANRIGVRTVAKAAAKKTAKGVIRTWAGTEGAGPGSGRASNASGSAKGSRGSSAAGSGRSSPGLGMAAEGGMAAPTVPPTVATPRERERER